MFSVLCNILLGVVGGIISSLIVSRVFLIQGEYQSQLKILDRYVNVINYTKGMFGGIRAVFESSYDMDIEIEKEMKKNGYKTENEFYAANTNRRWISVERLLDTLLSETKKIPRSILDEISNVSILDKELKSIYMDIREFLQEVISMKELTFSTINDMDKRCDELKTKYIDYKKTTTSVIMKKILKDKLMICLYVVLLVLIIGTLASYFWGI